MQNAYYSVVSTHAKLGTFTFENDYIIKPIDEQLAAITALVWAGEWDDVTACYLVDPIKGTCVDALRELASDAGRKGGSASQIARRVITDATELGCFLLFLAAACVAWIGLPA